MTTIEMLRPLFAKAWRKWGEDRAPRHAAALSFFFLLAMSPLALFFVAVTSLVVYSKISHGVLERGLVESVRNSMGAPAASFVQGLAQANPSRGASYLYSTLGLVVALFGSSGLFLQLRDSVNAIWEIKIDAKGIKGFLLQRVSSAFMVVVFVAVLSGWMILDSLVRFVRRDLGGEAGYTASYFLSMLIGWAFWTPVYAAIFKWLPQRPLQWRDVWLAGAFTSLAFAITKQLLSTYFRYGGISASYGTAGAVLVILLWAYYSAQILIYGVELTRVYAESYGSLRR